MIDKDGYRHNIGIILANDDGRLLWARRIGQEAWQFPQGGMVEGETPEQALYRELAEEVGLSEEDVTIMGCTQEWLHYRLPKNLIRYHSKPLCIGQKQKWFLLKLLSGDEKVSLQHSEKPEFDAWRWVDYWHPIDEVVSFKKTVYRDALEELASSLRTPTPELDPIS